MADTEINFDALAALRKWPSVKLAPSHHLYEIHTAPQGELITAVLSAEQIVEVSRLRDFL
jgi:hypothetical protein